MEIITDDLYQIALLIDQLKHDDIQLRVAASKSLCRIAKVLGPERTRDELIPFITESTDDEDEVLLVMSDVLGELNNFIGGNEFTYILFEPLELLLAVEEEKVRDKAIQSIVKIVSILSEEHIKRYHIPFLTRLSTKDWYTSRASAAALLHVGYEKMTLEDRGKIESLFMKLSSDDTPVVRRVSAQYFGFMVQKFSQTELREDFLSILLSLTSDDQESVRIQSLSSCISLSKSMISQSYMNQALPILSKASTDLSWRVRYSVAGQLHICFEVCSTDKKMILTLLDIFLSFLNDNESEVRAAAASTVYLVTKTLDKELIIDKIFPQLKKLMLDSSDNVRASLAHSVNDISDVIKKELTIDHLLPILLTFLRDSNSEVRLNVISTLEKLNKIIGVQLLSQSLLPAIIELSNDSKWRVRTSIIEYMAMIGKHLGYEIFREKLSETCLNWLKDNVYLVRKTASKNIQNLAQVFGEKYVRSEILPFLDKLQSDPSHVHRSTAIQCYNTLTGVVSSDICCSVILPKVISMSKDAVPNVRFAVVKSLHLFWTTSGVDATQMDEILKLCETLLTDTDKDVRYYAKKVLQDISLAQKK